MLKNNKISLRDLLSVFYKDEILINNITAKKFYKEFNLNDEEIKAFFSNLESKPSSVNNFENSYFILRTDKTKYKDKPEEYHFRKGIPGSVQLLKAEEKGKFIYIEKGIFYAYGEIGKIRESVENNQQQYYAEIKK